MTQVETNVRPTRVAVAGAGAFGRNHLRVYKELAAAGAVELCGVIDRDPATLAAAAALYGIPGFATIAECVAALPGLDAASVCVPTVFHAEAAEELMSAGVDVLIEKPIAASNAEADRIVALAEELGRVVQVGHPPGHLRQRPRIEGGAGVDEDLLQRRDLGDRQPGRQRQRGTVR